MLNQFTCKYRMYPIVNITINRAGYFTDNEWGGMLVKRHPSSGSLIFCKYTRAELCMRQRWFLRTYK